MSIAQISQDVAVWVITFGFGSIFSWLVWLTFRHYNYGKPAYDALAGGDMSDGHLETTTHRFDEIESAHENMQDRVSEIERKVDDVDEKTDRNYKLLEKIADRAGVDGVFYRGGSDEADIRSGGD